MSCGEYGTWVKISKSDTWLNPNTNEIIVPTQQELEKVKNMKIPPMWRPAFICNDNPKIAWLAKGKGGKLQYGYTQAWKKRRENLKILHIFKSMNSHFWNKFYSSIAHDKNKSTLAIAKTILNACHFRTGGGSTSGTTGLTTLKGEHISETESGIVIDFVGKSDL